MNEVSLSINETVMQIKESSEEKNSFIQAYKPFVAATVEKSIGRYVKYGEDDELSIALIAFEEAINCYDKSKGSFLSFSKIVIQKRLIDYYRKEKKHQNVAYLSDFTSNQDDMEGVYEDAVTSDESVNKYWEREINDLRKMELIELKLELQKWELTFLDVSKSSPKHLATKRAYLEAVKFLLDHQELVKKMKTKMYLPVADIEEGTKLPRKTIERARNYIIAAIIILTGDYYCIREFIDWGWMK